jgi:hypothetical protein
MNEEERSAFRAFVRDHHPDRGGDPDVFVAGLARFRGGSDDPRWDAPIEFVPPLSPPVRVAAALIRTWHRHRRRRVQ